MVKMFSGLISNPLLLTLTTVLVGYLINKRQENDREIKLKKRKVYEEFLTAITLVHFGNESLIQEAYMEKAHIEYAMAKLDVIRNYERIKLWGSKEVVDTCGFFLKNLISSNGNEHIHQEEKIKLYHDIIFEMRKDLKMKDFQLDVNNITIIHYSN